MPPPPLSTTDRLSDELADAGLPEYDGEGHKLEFHSFRHTKGTWLCENGVDLKVLQEALGHRTFAMTADRYTQARLERVAAEIAKLPELISAGRGTIPLAICLRKRRPTRADHVRPWPLTPRVTTPRMRF